MKLLKKDKCKLNFIVINIIESPKANFDEGKNDYIQDIVKRQRKLDPDLPEDVIFYPIRLCK